MKEMEGENRVIGFSGTGGVGRVQWCELWPCPRAGCSRHTQSRCWERGRACCGQLGSRAQRSKMGASRMGTSRVVFWLHVPCGVGPSQPSVVVSPWWNLLKLESPAPLPLDCRDGHSSVVSMSSTVTYLTHSSHCSRPERQPLSHCITTGKLRNTIYTSW